MGGSLDLATWTRARLGNVSRNANLQRLSLALGVATGMGYIHNEGYIHADLKPANVRFWSRGPTSRLLGTSREVSAWLSHSPSVEPLRVPV